MPWTYHQSTGVLEFNGRTVSDWGYSGTPQAKNNPAREDEVLVGPIPRGRYRIGALQANGGHMGHDVLPLSPIGHSAAGRSGFYIHGYSVARPGTASQDCIILPHEVRSRISTSPDRELEVVR